MHEINQREDLELSRQPESTELNERHRQSMSSLREEQPTEYLSAEDVPQLEPVVSNYHAIAVEKAEQLASPEIANLITEIITEIDRQGIESFTTFETGEVTLPVSVVSVNTIFDKFFRDKIPQGNSDEVVSVLENKAKSRTSVILPGFAPPPVGHPFTPWDYVYAQVFKDLPRLINAHKRGEELPQIDIRVLGSANSHWGKMTPQWVEDIRKKGFAAHGENVANYLRPIIQEKDYVRVTGISMGGPIAIETMEQLTDEELAKMQFVLDNPADQLYSSKVLEFIRNVQLPVGFGLSYLQVMARLRHYFRIYNTEGDFLTKFNEKTVERRRAAGESTEIPGFDEEQKKLKQAAAVAEARQLIRQPKPRTDKKAFVVKGAADLTTSTFGDQIRRIKDGLLKRGWIQEFADKHNIRFLKAKTYYKLGERYLFTVRGGHQRDNFRIDKWARVIEGSGIFEKQVSTDEDNVEIQEESMLSKWKKKIQGWF